MSEKKRILCIVGGMNAGGAETFLMKLYRKLDKSKYQMDFYVTDSNEGYYDKEILSLGGKIYRSVPKSKNLLKSLKNLANVVKKNNYKYVMRVSQHSLSTLELLVAKLNGADVLIYRSSNSKTGGGKINTLLHYFFKWMSIRIPNIKIAPSTEAAEFMFGKNCIINKNAKILKNGIPLELFQFDEKKRNKIRNEFKIEEKFVIGHVGRFSEQKNHYYLLDVFSEIVKLNNDSVLLLVGNGNLENKIKERVKRLGLENQVVFAGTRSNIPEILMAMDVFIFPSFFEGLPNSVIEAQATGLPCLISDTITSEVKIIDEVKFMSIKEQPSNWAKEALTMTRNNEIENIRNKFIRNGYDINKIVDDFIDLIET